MKWITAADIDNWTIREPRKAQESIPLLIWKLILASCNTINDHHFPFGKAIQYSGYDGFLDTDDTSPFFPSGKSVWEIGTNENALDKFNNDYEKRTKEPNGVILSVNPFLKCCSSNFLAFRQRRISPSSKSSHVNINRFSSKSNLIIARSAETSQIHATYFFKVHG